MKRITLLLSILITSLNLYSQQDLVKRENIIIISELTSEICTNIQDVYPKFFEKEYFKFSQISSENMVCLDKNISAIIETPYKFETKFGKTEKIELKEYEIKYFYDEDGFLKQIQNKIGKTELKIGKFGELIKEQISYETNTFGISKIIKYDDEGKVLTRYEIFYNPKGQIVKFNSFDKNSTSKKHTKTFEYDNFGKLTKSMLFENFNDEIKIIPRRNIVNSYSDKSLISKSISNSFAEGVNYFNDFSKVNAVKNNNYYQKTVSIRNKTIQEIKTEIQKRWIESPVFYEFTFLKEREINNWEEKKIFNKLYNQTNEKELIYCINRKYINKEDFEKENNISEIREKLNTFIDAIYSNQSFKNEENTKKFAAFDVDLERFCFWFNADRQYVFPEDENYTKEIVQFYKDNSRQLAKNYKAKIEDKALTNEELSTMFDKISKEYQTVIDQTLSKIENRKKIVAIETKNKVIDKTYILHPESANYRSIKKENLYSAYVILYNFILEQPIIENDTANEFLKIQQKMLSFDYYNTAKLEKALKNVRDEKLIAKTILDFQLQ